MAQFPLPHHPRHRSARRAPASTARRTLHTLRPLLFTLGLEYTASVDSGVDRRHLISISGLIREVAASGAVVVLISHDEDLLAVTADSELPLERLGWPEQPQTPLGDDNHFRYHLFCTAPALANTLQ